MVRKTYKETIEQQDRPTNRHIPNEKKIHIKHQHKQQQQKQPTRRPTLQPQLDNAWRGARCGGAAVILRSN